ncbi:MAG: hypothetical protein ABEJ74_02605 [Haloferacaceae archaeon]
MARVSTLTLRADATGTLELVCERAESDEEPPTVRSFSGKDEFGLVVDGLAPDEPVTLYLEPDGVADSADAR